MKFGICCSPTSLPDSDLQASVKRLFDHMEAAGADYVEFGVGVTEPEGDEAQFEALRDALAGQKLKPEVFNSFIPAHHRITGPEVDLGNVLRYAETALRRCKQLGGEVVVLGSGGARRAPDEFDSMVVAQRQFLQFCREVAPIAQDIGITIVIEPLNKREDNLINTVAHGAIVVEQVAHPAIQLLADLYHMAEDSEPMAHVCDAGTHLAHTHLADRGRVAPGFASDGEEDFLGFFRALRSVGYDSRCSFEGKFENMSEQLKPALGLMKQRWNESHNED